MLASIIKRDGTEVPFDSVKILNAITKANQAVGGESQAEGVNFFACPICGEGLPDAKETQSCPGCGHEWEYKDGIYEFRINPEN